MKRLPQEVQVTVENIVAQNERGAGGISKEICGDQKRLSDAFGLGLRRVGNADPDSSAVAKKFAMTTLIKLSLAPLLVA